MPMTSMPPCAASPARLARWVSTSSIDIGLEFSPPPRAERIGNGPTVGGESRTRRGNATHRKEKEGGGRAARKGPQVHRRGGRRHREEGGQVQVRRDGRPRRA